jgi:16S rRNA (cytosine967-C5)-methyltransferase
MPNHPHSSGGSSGRSRWAPGAEALAAAARVVEAVAFGGQTVDVPLAHAASPVARPAVRAIALGTIRWYLRLLPAIERLLERPAGVPRPIRALLAAAAHQLEFSRNAPEAVVHAAVDAARLLRSSAATGLVNAVLRRFLTERTALFASIDSDLARRTAHPEWLVARLCAAWGGKARTILEAGNLHPPLVLRVDLSSTTPEAYLSRLREVDIDAREIQWSPGAVVLERPVGVDRLPGFAEGQVSVQDAGAQLAAPLLGAAAGLRVLDACAAPGGKTGHLLELLGARADLTAVDIDAERAELITRNLVRLKRTARVIAADVRRPESFWDGRPFDRILVDAPCSSTGVIRRHPDIKLLRRATDIAAFVATQGEILHASARMLAPGGRLLYSTCSVLPEENEEVISAYLAAEPGMRVVPMPVLITHVPGALQRPIGVQLLPGSAAGTDGFYYACLEKTTDAS